jgi:dihydroflavonol-4-reductase
VGERYILGGYNVSMVDFLGLVARQCRQLGISSAPRKAPALRIPYRVAWLTGSISTAWSDYVTHREPAVALEAVKMSKRYMYFDSAKAVRELGYLSTLGTQGTQARSLEKPVNDALLWFLEHGYFSSSRALNSKRKPHVHPA